MLTKLTWSSPTWFCSLVHSTQSHYRLELKVNPLVHVSNMQWRLDTELGSVGPLPWLNILNGLSTYHFIRETCATYYYSSSRIKILPSAHVSELHVAMTHDRNFLSHHLWNSHLLCLMVIILLAVQTLYHLLPLTLETYTRRCILSK